MAKATKKKAAAKKASAKKSATKKAASKSAAKKPAAKKSTAKKAASKSAAKKPAAKKAAAKKTPAKKAAAKKTASTSAAKKPAAKKAASKKKTAAKKTAPKKVAPADTIDDKDNEDRPIKVDKPCPYNASELQEWRLLLKQRYLEVSGDIKDLLHDAMDSEDGHTLPTHQADRGSDVDLQDLSLGMLDDEETLLWQIERALHKIDTGSPIAFGLCEHSYDPIPEGRLRLLPWTPLSIQGAAYMEEQGYTLHDMIIDE